MPGTGRRNEIPNNCTLKLRHGLAAETKVFNVCSMPYKTILLGLTIAMASFSQNQPQFVWQGDVDGIVVLHLSGKNLSVQIQDGGPVEHQKFHFYDFLPQTMQSARVDVLGGRGYVHVIAQPTIENHYILSIAIEDRQPGKSPYSIAVYWDTSNTRFERGPQKTGEIAWKGRVDEGATISCRKQSCSSSVEQGAPVADERFKFSRALPDRSANLRLENTEGRGEILLIEQPAERNNYTARVSIRDPLPGTSEYSFKLVWDRASSKELKEAAAIPEAASRAFHWTGTVDGRIRVTIKGGASLSEVMEGGPVVDQHAEFVRPLPARSDLMPVIRKIRGRGQAAIVEPPSEKNNYALTFEINDTEPGADQYEIELDW